MARLDEGDIHVLDTVGRNVDRAVEGLEERIRRLEAALAGGLTGVNRGIAELWRELHGKPAPAVRVTKPETKEAEAELETADPAAVKELNDAEKEVERVEKRVETAVRKVRHRLI